MKKLFVVAAVLVALSSGSAVAGHRHNDGDCCTAPARRGYAYSYYTPGDFFTGSVSYVAGVTNRVGRGLCEIVSAPFTTVPVMPAPRTYVYYPPKVEFEYTPPVVERIYPPRGYWYSYSY